MKTIKTMLPLFFVVVLITSCSDATSQPRPTFLPPTFTREATYEVVETQMLPTMLPQTEVATPVVIEPVSASEAAFWAQVGAAMPSNVVATEHIVLDAVAALSQSPQTHDGFDRHLAMEVEFFDVPTPKKLTYKDIGYEIVHGPEQEASEGGGVFRIPYIAKNGKVLIDAYFLRASEVYRVSTASGSVDAFIVVTEHRQGRDEYLIQNGKITKWGFHSELDPWFRPILYQGELLWAKLSYDQIDIKKSNGEIVFTTPVFWMNPSHSRFRSWHDHWILQADDVVAMDGETLNAKLGFSKVFKWDLINDKPIFLFQKQTRYGVSYDGQVLPLQYDDIAHGMCCSPAMNNPWVHDHWISFFGKRDGVWYSVLVEIK